MIREDTNASGMEREPAPVGKNGVALHYGMGV